MSGQFFLQITIILLSCRAVGRLMPFIGQPRVIGEMIAGVLLGPSEPRCWPDARTEKRLRLGR